MKGATLKGFRAYSGRLVSIHAPNEGSDVTSSSTCPPLFMFQSTLPMKGATSRGNGLFRLLQVSIHAPNEGSDHLILILR